MELSICDIISSYNKKLNVYNEFKNDIKEFNGKKINNKIFDINYLDKFFNEYYMEYIYQTHHCNKNFFINNKKNKIITVLIHYIYDIFSKNIIIKQQKTLPAEFIKILNNDRLIKSFLELYIKIIKYINKTNDIYKPQLIDFIVHMNFYFFEHIIKCTNDSEKKKDINIKLKKIYKSRNFEFEQSIALKIDFYNEIKNSFL